MMAATPPKPHRITVSLGEREYGLLSAIATARDVSLSWAARRAIAEYIERSNEFEQGTLPLIGGRLTVHDRDDDAHGR